MQPLHMRLHCVLHTLGRESSGTFHAAYTQPWLSYLRIHLRPYCDIAYKTNQFCPSRHTTLSQRCSNVRYRRCDDVELLAHTKVESTSDIDIVSTSDINVVSTSRINVVTTSNLKGSRNKSENYRPVSLTSVICKLLERLIKDHMVDFLVKHKLLNSSQYGFLKARSCLTNMLCFLEEITKWIDVGSPVDIIYLDFQKAFDKVPHQRLLLKLKAHGIGDSITDWIEQ